MSYADLAAFKAYLRIPEGDTEDDLELQRALDTATSEIRHMCSRDFTPAGDTATVRYFQPFWDGRTGRWILPIDDLFTVEDLTVKSWTEDDTDWTTTVDVAEMDLRPLGPVDRPWTEILLPTSVSFPRSQVVGWASDSNSDYLAVAARWGWYWDGAPGIPPAIVEATCVQASRTFKRRDAPFGVTASPDGSENTRLTNTVDVEVQVAIRGYVKYWAAR